MDTVSRQMAAALAVMMKTKLRVFGFLADKEPLERYESLKMIRCPPDKTQPPNA